MNMASPELLSRPQSKVHTSSMLRRAAHSSTLGKPNALSKANCACGGSCLAYKAKSDSLKVSQPNDPAEIEADQVAENIMRMPLKGAMPITNDTKSFNTSTSSSCRAAASSSGRRLRKRLHPAMKGG